MDLHGCSPDFWIGGDDCGQNLGWTSRRNVQPPPAPPQYSVAEWGLEGDNTTRIAENSRIAAEQVQAESMRVVEETYERTDAAESDIQLRFNHRLAEVRHWTSELTRKFEEIDDEVDVQSIYRRRLETFAVQLCHIVKVDHTATGMRNCRLGIDLVFDDPQRELVHEIKVVEGIKEVVHKTVERVVEQIRLLRKTAFVLNKEMVEKDAALEVDEYAQSLNCHRSEVKRQARLLIDPHPEECAGEDWEEFAVRQKTLADNCITAARHLRFKVDSLLRQSYQDIQLQICKTDRALHCRLQELFRAKDRLQTQLCDIFSTAHGLDSMIRTLSHAFEEKKSKLALAETRINIRARRPNKEMIKDAIQMRLLLEIDELNQAMVKLNTKILQSHNALRKLLRTQLGIEDAINLKINTIAIDETQVLPLRKTIRIHE